MNKIIQFDRGLIGPYFKKGYRLQLYDLDYKTILDYLCNNFGEGKLSNNIVQNDSWFLIDRCALSKTHPKYITVLIKEYDILKTFCEQFNIAMDIDDSQLTINKLQNIIDNYIFKLKNRKNLCKIKEEIRLALNIHIKNIQMTWEKIDIFVDDQIFSLNI